MIFVLVHSPLVGPGTWSPVAQELERRRHGALIPSLHAQRKTTQRDWRHTVAAASAALGRLTKPVVLVGHSGAGPLLPAIADAASAPVSTLIIVDSGLPVKTGETPMVPPFVLEHLRTLAVDGMLPPWSEWFGEDAMRQLVPDHALRSALEREMPQLPLAYFEQQVTSPPGWDDIHCTYLLLSDAYRTSAEEARQRGWRTEEIEGAQNLHIVIELEHPWADRSDSTRSSHRAMSFAAPDGLSGRYVHSFGRNPRTRQFQSDFDLGDRQPVAMSASSRAYERDPRVDAYIARLPHWQRDICQRLRDLIHSADPEVVETIKRTVQPYFVLQGNICALLAAKDHVNLFLYDGGIVPDPEGIITAGHTNKAARTISFRQGEAINRQALTAMLKQIIANNRAGGWRKLKRR
jgi:hypothetical protein